MPAEQFEIWVIPAGRPDIMTFQDTHSGVAERAGILGAVLAGAAGECQPMRCLDAARGVFAIASLMSPESAVMFMVGIMFAACEQKLKTTLGGIDARLRSTYCRAENQAWALRPQHRRHLSSRPRPFRGPAGSGLLATPSSASFWTKLLGNTPLRPPIDEDPNLGRRSRTAGANPSG
jgi:hypothetical protein